MASNLNYKQVANVSRRTWDAETYEKKAKERQKAVQNGDDSTNNKRKQGPSDNDDTTRNNNNNSSKLEEEFIPAPKDAIGPEGSDRAYLKARTGHADIDSKIGTAEIISATAAATSKAHDNDDNNLIRDGGVTKTGVGWHCRVCDCFLKDSHTYLDHINGRKHQRKLGYSMRVVRSTKDELQEKLQQLSKQKTASVEDQKDANFEEIVKEKDEEARRRKEERERKRKERKARLKEQAEQPEDGDEDEELEAEIDPALASMMGFSGFGGGK